MDTIWIYVNHLQFQVMEMSSSTLTFITKVKEIRVNRSKAFCKYTFPRGFRRNLINLDIFYEKKELLEKIVEN